MPKNSSPISVAFDANTSSSSLPAQLERKIAGRWKEWEPWVWLYLRHRGCAAAGSSELARLRRRHSEHLRALIWAGIGMRLVRRHRLDDPRITDEVRAALVRAALARRKKAWLARRRAIGDPQRLLESDFNNPDIGAASPGNSLLRLESSQPSVREPERIAGSQEERITIDLIQELVSRHFNLCELRDQSLKARTNRLVVAFPRQVAMYIARQLTAVSLEEIGRQFGGMHHTTVLHSINKVADMRRSNEALNHTIMLLMNALQ